MNIGDKIKKIREEKGISTYKLADIITNNGFKISQSAISKIENGNKKLDVEILTKITDALDISILELIDDKKMDKLINLTLSKSEQAQIKFISSVKFESFQTLVKAIEINFDEIDNEKLYETIYLRATTDLYPLIEKKIEDKITNLVKEYSNN